MEVKALKCIGGSKDGATMMVGGGTSYFTAEYTTDEDLYTRRTLYTIELFALESMSDYEVVELLVDRYRP